MTVIASGQTLSTLETPYNVHCTLYPVYCTLHTAHRTLYTVHCTLYLFNSHCILYTVHPTNTHINRPCTLYTLKHGVHTVQNTLYTEYCTLNQYTVKVFQCVQLHFKLNVVLCTLYNINCTYYKPNNAQYLLHTTTLISKYIFTVN